MPVPAENISGLQHVLQWTYTPHWAPWGVFCTLPPFRLCSRGIFQAEASSMCWVIVDKQDLTGVGCRSGPLGAPKRASKLASKTSQHTRFQRNFCSCRSKWPLAGDFQLHGKHASRSPQFGVGRRGSPQFVPTSPFSSDLFRFALLVFGKTPICSALLRFLPICFQKNQNKSGKPLSAS